MMENKQQQHARPDDLMKTLSDQRMGHQQKQEDGHPDVNSGPCVFLVQQRFILSCVRLSP